jgi:hypothetical protein
MLFSSLYRWINYVVVAIKSVILVCFTLTVVIGLLLLRVISCVFRNFVVTYANPIAAVATALLALATLYLARDAGRQITIMEDDQRPWVKVETEIAGPLEFIIGGFGNLPLRFTLTNVGKSPAFNVTLVPWGFLVFQGHNDTHKEQRERCGSRRDQPLDNPARGSVLFPGDHLLWDQLGASGVGYSPDEIQKGLVDENGQRDLHIWIIGCADYVFGEPKRHHQTGFIYSLGRIIPREGMEPALTFGIVPQGTISRDQLRLFPSPSASLID